MRILVVDIFVDILFVCNSYQRASWDKYLGQIFTANSAGNHQKFPGRTSFVYICISEDLRGHSECYLSPRGSVSEPHKWNKWSGEKGWKGVHKYINAKIQTKSKNKGGRVYINTKSTNKI